MKSHAVTVTKKRMPEGDMPEGCQDPEFWFRFLYTLHCDGRTYEAWSYESDPGTVNMTGYWEEEKPHEFESVPYRDSTFCRVAWHLSSVLGIPKVIVWVRFRPQTLDLKRLK